VPADAPQRFPQRTRGVAMRPHVDGSVVED
jgi:hypothetical protein